MLQQEHLEGLFPFLRPKFGPKSKGPALIANLNLRPYDLLTFKWFTEVPIGTPHELGMWKELRKIRIATCPYKNCKTYTSVFAIRPDGTYEPLIGWEGYTWDLPFQPFWDERPWCWFTTNFLTGTSASNQTDTVPGNWNSSNNTIECIGTGGSGSAAAGAYAKITNLSLTPGGSVTYFVGASQYYTTQYDCWYNGTTLAGSSVGAEGGQYQDANPYSTGGRVANSIGTTKYAGGDIHYLRTHYGGAGAGGPGGAGGRGGFATDATNSYQDNYGAGGGGGSGGSAGGDSNGTAAGAGGGANGGAAGTTGDGTSGGAGGGGGGGGKVNSGAAPSGGYGGNGTDFDSSHGAGGGSGGGGWAPNGGAGSNDNRPAGNYGAAGGGPGYAPGFGGYNSAGSQGMIAITYVPTYKPGMILALGLTR